MAGEVRLPPQAIDSEMAVLGSMLLFPESVDVALGTLSVDMFYKAAHRVIFEAMMELVEKKIAIDIISVAQFLTESNQIEKVGGEFYLTELIEKEFSAANAESHCLEVMKRAQLRKMITIASKLQNECYEAGAEPVDLGAEAAKEILDLVAYGESEFSLVSDSLPDVIQMIDEAKENKGKISGITSGLEILDHITTGFHGGDLIIIAARPGQGKTSLALNFARHIVKHNIPVGMISLEMRERKLIMRLLAMEAKIDGTKAKLGELETDDYVRIDRAISQIAVFPLYLDCSAGQNLAKMLSRIRSAVIRFKFKIVIIDYLQLISVQSKYFNRNVEIGFVTSALKNLAVELNIPVIALSQLSREIERGRFRLPILSDLRESGNIENDADVVLFICRPELSGLERYKLDRIEYDAKNLAILLLAKHRDGASNKKIALQFIPERTEFLAIDEHHEEPIRHPDEPTYNRDDDEDVF